MKTTELTDPKTNAKWSCLLTEENFEGWWLDIKSEKPGEKTRTFKAMKTINGVADPVPFSSFEEAKKAKQSLVKAKLAEGFVEVFAPLNVYSDPLMDDTFGCLKGPHTWSIITKGTGFDPADVAHDFDMFFALMPSKVAVQAYKNLVDYFRKDSEDWVDDSGQVGFALFKASKGNLLLACFDSELNVFGEDPDIWRFIENDDVKVLEGSVCHAGEERCKEELPDIFKGNLGKIFAF